MSDAREMALAVAGVAQRVAHTGTPQDKADCLELIDSTLTCFKAAVEALEDARAVITRQEAKG